MIDKHLVDDFFGIPHPLATINCYPLKIYTKAGIVKTQVFARNKPEALAKGHRIADEIAHGENVTFLISKKTTAIH